jgi:DNA repair ATPase RecN
VLAVQLGLKVAAEKQEEAENSVPEEDENAQTLSLQASELKEMEPSGTEARPLTANAEQVSHCTTHCECACSWEVNRKAGCEDVIF